MGGPSIAMADFVPKDSFRACKAYPLVRDDDDAGCVFVKRGTPNSAFADAVLIVQLSARLDDLRGADALHDHLQCVGMIEARGRVPLAIM